MVDLNDCAGFSQRWFIGELLHRQDRSARHIQRIERFHNLELRLGHRPLLDQGKALIELRQARLRRRPFRVGDELFASDHLHQRLPPLRLDDHVDVIVGTTGRALDRPTRLPAPRRVARTWHLLAEGCIRVLRILLQRTVRKPLLVAQLDAAQVQHTVLHGTGHALAAPRLLSVKQGSDDAQCQMQASARITDLCTRHHRWAVVKTGCACRAAGTLRHVLVHLAVLVRPRAEALDRGIDHARVDLLDALPGEAHAIERARRKVLHHHVAVFDQRGEDLLAVLALGVQGDAALVVIEHGEVQAVDVGNVAQLAACGITDAGALNLDDVSTKPGQ